MTPPSAPLIQNVPVISRSPSSSVSSPSPQMDRLSSMHASQVHAASASRTLRSSATWTSSSAELANLSDSEDLEDRTYFITEYNRLAQKHGVSPLQSEDFDPVKFQLLCGPPPVRMSWLSRLLRHWSSDHAASLSNEGRKAKKHNRVRTLVQKKLSVSDLALHLMHHRRESPPSLDLQTMIRLSGKSLFYLPVEYSPGSLILPTCIRATAQYLAQNAPQARGVFRIPGSVRVVNTLYDYYCGSDEDSGDIAGTVRCANLPLHIHAGMNDVASTFKKLLAALPGGILGSLPLFDAFASIRTCLFPDTVGNRPKQARVRARLIALAIAAVPSQQRRELICAVFGLLCLIGRAAETAPREDDVGRPLPTSDLMGYSALGVVFGPLLVGDRLAFCTSRRATTPNPRLVVSANVPSPQSPSPQRNVNTRSTNRQALITQRGVDRIHLANEIAEMIITGWRDVVRQLHSLHALQHRPVTYAASADFAGQGPSSSIVRLMRPSASASAIMGTRTPSHRELTMVVPDIPTFLSHNARSAMSQPPRGLSVPRHRVPIRRVSSARLTDRPAYNQLSPTVEETGIEWPRPVQSEARDNERRGGHAAVAENPTPTAPMNSTSRMTAQAGLPSGPRDDSIVPAGSPRSSPRVVDSSLESDSGSVVVKPTVYQPEWPSTPITSEPQSAESRHNDTGGLPLRRSIAVSRRIAKSPRHVRGRASESVEESDGCDCFGGGDKTDSLVSVDARASGGQRSVGLSVQTPTSLRSSESVQVGAHSTMVQATGIAVQGHPSRQFNSGRSEVEPRTAAWEGRPSLGSTYAQPSASQRQSPSPCRGRTSLAQTPDQQTRVYSQSLGSSSVARNVKAMAAMFERTSLVGGSSKALSDAPTPTPSGTQQRRRILAAYTSHASPAGRSTTSTPAMWSSPATVRAKNDRPSRRPSFVANDNETLGDASRRLRASATTYAASEDKLPIFPQLQLKVCVRKAGPDDAANKASERPVTRSLLQPLANLGTMVPYREPPPVAQYVGLSRPVHTASTGLGLSSASLLPPLAPPSPLGPSHAPRTLSTRDEGIGRRSSLLHTQIRLLQRQLEARTDELTQVRRQLEARAGAEAATLSERLREAERKCSMWTERAMAAERRVKALESVAARAYSQAPYDAVPTSTAVRGRMVEPDGVDSLEGAPGLMEDGWREFSGGTVEMWIAAQGLLCADAGKAVR